MSKSTCILYKHPPGPSRVNCSCTGLGTFFATIVGKAYLFSSCLKLLHLLDTRLSLSRCQKGPTWVQDLNGCSKVITTFWQYITKSNHVLSSICQKLHPEFYYQKPLNKYTSNKVDIKKLRNWQHGIISAWMPKDVWDWTRRQSEYIPVQLGIVCSM